LSRKVSEKDFLKAGLMKDTLKNQFAIAKAVGSLKTVKYLDADKKTGLVMPSDMDSVKVKIDLFIKENKLAKQMVERWFNIDAAGNFNYDLIMERGRYSASAGEKDLSAKMVTGADYLYDEELLGNTFTVFNKLKFYPNEPVARVIQIAALAEANQISQSFLKEKAIKSVNDIYERTKEGYTVVNTSFLYRLDWSPKNIEAFKAGFVNEKDAARRKAFLDTTSSLRLNFLGEQTSISLVTFKIGEKRSMAQVIDLSVKRNIDKVFAMLQREYEVFRPVAPINTSSPLTARIGLKEGVEPGQKYEIIESAKDAKTGLYKWKSVGSTKVDKKLPIWDNRIGAAEEAGAAPSSTPANDFTTFSGGSDAVPGLHYIRLKK
jgi:hypothetical protein